MDTTLQAVEAGLTCRVDPNFGDPPVKTLESSPHLLPAGYRLIYRFFLAPIEIAGVHRWLEYVPVVQRLMRGRDVG